MYLNAIERTGGSFAGEDAYLEGIPAIAGLGLLELHQPVTFLVGENGSGKSTLLRLWPWPWDSTPRGAPGTSPFPPGTPTPGCTTICGCTGAPTAPRTGFPAGGELLQRLQRGGPAGQLPARGRPLPKLRRQVAATTSPTGRASSAWCTTGFGAKASTCWTSRRPPSPPPGS